MNRSLRITLTSLAALLATVTLTAPAFAAIDMFIKFDAKGPTRWWTTRLVRCHAAVE